MFAYTKLLFAVVASKLSKAIFGYGGNGVTLQMSITNLVSNTGIVASDTTGVGTARVGLSGASYGTDKAIFGYGLINGSPGTYLSLTNLVSNTGVVSVDTTGVGTARTNVGAANYGTDKAIFGYGYNGFELSMTNKVSNTGVVSTDTTGVGTPRMATTASPYGSDKAIFAYGMLISSPYQISVSNLVSNTGVVASNTTGVGTARSSLAAASYGTDKAIFGYGLVLGGSPQNVSMTNLVSNTGVVASDTTGVGSGRWNLAAAPYGSGTAIFGYGTNGTIYLSVTNKVSNTGVVSTDTTGVGTARWSLGASNYGVA